MREERNFVDEALLKKYPTIKRTVERARKLGFIFVAHRALFTKRGKVYQHWLYIQSIDNLSTATEWRHDELKGWCSVLEEAKRKAKETGL